MNPDSILLKMDLEHVESDNPIRLMVLLWKAAMVVEDFKSGCTEEEADAINAQLRRLEECDQ